MIVTIGRVSTGLHREGRCRTGTRHVSSRSAASRAHASWPMYAPDRLRFPTGRSVLRSLTICGVLLGLTACAVGSESTALQAPADPPAGELHPDATEAGLLVLGMLSRGAEALATGNAAEAPRLSIPSTSRPASVASG